MGRGMRILILLRIILFLFRIDPCQMLHMSNDGEGLELPLHIPIWLAVPARWLCIIGVYNGLQKLKL